MDSIGIDLHKRESQLCTITEDGELLEESDDGIWSLYLGSVLLGKIDEATMRVSG